MIGKLTGRLDAAGKDWIILDVGGVGYRLSCSARTLRALPPAGHDLALLVETQFRDESIQLFGFADPGEQAWFRLLQRVQSIGPRLALAILSARGPDELARAIAAEDKRALTEISGIGPKVATRIVNELKDHVAELQPSPGAAATGAPAGVTSNHSSDAISALVNLGYRRIEAFGAINKAEAALGPEAPVEALIKAGLKELSA